MLDCRKIKAISLDLDDTLWPIWPTIERAEKLLHGWLAEHAPATATLFGDAAALRHVRDRMTAQRPDLRHDLSALRRESIRLALRQAGDDPALAEGAFEAFYAARQQVTLFDDALPALEFLAARFPVVSLSNGNADLERIGIHAHFRAAVSARTAGVGKPDRRIFDAAAAAAGVPAQEVLHVGDDVALDVLGAMDAGMQAAWLNRGDHPWTHQRQPHATVANLDALCALLRP